MLKLLAVLQFFLEEGFDLLAEGGDDALLLVREGLFELGQLFLVLFLDHLDLQIFVPDFLLEEGDVGGELVDVVLEVADLLFALVEFLVKQGLLLVAFDLQLVDVI